MEKPKLSVSTLILETTRRCNMCCAHCLRGDAENVDMDPSIASSVLKSMDSIYSLTFSGGEPSLNPKLINLAIDECENNGVDVNQAFIATNGKDIPDSFVDACRRLEQWLLEKNLMDYCSDKVFTPSEIKRIIQQAYNEEREYGLTLSISADEYHEGPDPKSFAKLLPFRGLNIMKVNEDTSDRWIIRTGRAEENGIGSVSPHKERSYAYGMGSDCVDVEYQGNGSFYIEEIFIGAKGQITTYCDYSYGDQDEYALGIVEPGDDRWLEKFLQKNAPAEWQEYLDEMRPDGQQKG